MERAIADNSITHQHHVKRYEYSSRFIKDKSVCSVACGNGYGEKLMAEIGAPEEIFAFDISREAIENARAQNHHPLVTFEDVSKMEQMIKPGSVDVFISLETIEHIQDDIGFLEKTIWPALKPGGLLLISTPNKRSSFRNAFASKPLNKFHVREYTKNHFLELLTKKFVDVELFGQKTIVKRSFGNVIKYFWLKTNGKLNVLEKNDFEIRPFPENETYEMAYMYACCRKPQ